MSFLCEMHVVWLATWEAWKDKTDRASPLHRDIRYSLTRGAPSSLDGTCVMCLPMEWSAAPLVLGGLCGLP